MRTTLLENDSLLINHESGILFFKFKETTIDLSVAKKIINYRLSVSEKNFYPICSDVRSVKKITKDAKNYFASDKGCEGIIAGAILIDSTLGRMIGNFFISISKPKVPARIYTNEKEAIKWLKNFI